MQRENHHDLDQELTRMLVDIQLLDILDIVSEGQILQCEKSSEKSTVSSTIMEQDIS